MSNPDLLGRVARMNYEHGMTHREIGELLGLSRIKVTRLLAEARVEGIVEIKIHSDATLFADLERKLADAFSLENSWIAPTLPDATRNLESVGLAGARALRELAPNARVIAVGLSSSVAAIIPNLQGEPPLDLAIAPVAGSWGGVARSMNPHDLALALGKSWDAKSYHLPAPLLANSAETGRALKNDSSVRETIRIASSADVFIAGIGGLDDKPGSILSALSADEKAELHELGAVGDISGRFFDTRGNPIRGSVDQRIIGLELGELAAIPRRVGVAFGAGKVPAIHAALQARLINILVTDTETATLLLQASAQETR